RARDSVAGRMAIEAPTPPARAGRRRARSSVRLRSEFLQQHLQPASRARLVGLARGALRPERRLFEAREPGRGPLDTRAPPPVASSTRSSPLVLLHNCSGSDFGLARRMARLAKRPALA